MKRNTVILIAVLICIVGGIASWMAFVHPPTETIKVKVFHAGSLAVPFEELENEFEDEYSNVDLQRESSGSVEAVRKIAEVGKVADVIAVADYHLIPDMMMPEYADWYIRFAKNDMVLAYTDKSNYADEITEENWYEILREPDVKFGFSNPNLDPCGYRTLMVFKLAELYYNTSIFDLITNNTKITINETDGTYLIKSPEHLEPRGKVTIRDKSVDLVHLVKAGEIDYAFEYRSVAVQHGLKFVDLPAQIDLSDVEYTDLYGKVKLMDATGEIRTGNPIVYGITVPNNAINEELGIEFVKLVISEEGQNIFRRLGHTPIVPAEASGNLLEELDPVIVSASQTN
ncbi:MAG: tungstate ABC transporter substrate-binding protein WtpA [Candidatus Methanoliparum thermophilum]|uniref:Tungstate ABC transporter substrate-binding protein WtpA n=1 Tax=Methanoliparum thermophilum TaxID=2491083 RepID=A0A520KSQ4_METT2|nr:tungstate ABC transporter substrate-binding protein WtpA [Candidatus Methanoliparum sp. LAM-1]RZN64942.1 MAG: tungstate ABC transporter substrate-binding protein WtpA [Candidatus Methanoliparum thermophilum]BDC36176.1 tungstate ABC transporter substrate-binding protein WtpA [Candidatus Methanoliparum sp. LAM-1]